MGDRRWTPSLLPGPSGGGGGNFWVGDWGGGVASHGETSGELINDGEATAPPVVCLLSSPTSCFFFFIDSFRIKADETRKILK